MVSERTIRDASLVVTKALPAAAASNNSDSIDLESIGSSVLESIELEIVIPATPSLVEAKTVIVHLEDSADDSTFADIDELGSITVTGAAAAAGGAAVTKKFRLPSTTRRYVRFSSAVLTGGGDNTGVSVTMSILS